MPPRHPRSVPWSKTIPTKLAWCVHQTVFNRYPGGIVHQAPVMEIGEAWDQAERDWAAMNRREKEAWKRRKDIDCRAAFDEYMRERTRVRSESYVRALLYGAGMHRVNVRVLRNLHAGQQGGVRMALEQDLNYVCTIWGIHSNQVLQQQYLEVIVFVYEHRLHRLPDAVRVDWQRKLSRNQWAYQPCTDSLFPASNRRVNVANPNVQNLPTASNFSEWPPHRFDRNHPGVPDWLRGENSDWHFRRVICARNSGRVLLFLEYDDTFVIRNRRVVKIATHWGHDPDNEEGPRIPTPWPGVPPEIRVYRRLRTQGQYPNDVTLECFGHALGPDRFGIDNVKAWLFLEFAQHGSLHWFVHDNE
ncbi:hypothetical protein BDY21DRAFT_11744 [Lineolata rhizophorae]|uniref:Uncharacterized protein n=1 Tax=Lineolata rhizophorae TaxID=578093 RepID=A0A6A6PEC8_9PEZI|nr:hypothetical protein BDY21DRAFT_11744 [Lineolata rhizophorae]